MLVRLLLVTGTPALRRRLRRLIGDGDVLCAEGPVREGVWRRLAGESFDLLIAERSALPEPISDTVSTIRKLPDRPEIVVLQRREESEERAALLASGCLAVVPADLSDDTLGRTLRALVVRRREALLGRLRDRSEETRYGLDDFASSSEAMQGLLATARRVARSDSSLLILGETGVGKEWLARAIHAEGPRATAPLIAVNCAAVPDSLLESELFGHERGAFTGAARARRGFFELAHRGTIFLDEIADMSPHLQAKLLRVLQERQIQRVGAERPIAIDVRVMAATNRDLEREIASGSFRRDLYYRLSVVTLTLPPLRGRREDIPVLLENYLERFRAQFGRPWVEFEPRALDALLAYSWPGNVRELINVVERSVLLAGEGDITVADLPEGIGDGEADAAVSGGAPGPKESRDEESRWLERPLAEVRAEAVAEVERRYLAAQLRQTAGRVGETARRAGISERALYGKMRRLGLAKETFRPG